MDEDIVRWILEYLLRNPVGDLLVNTALSVLPIDNSDSRLKKTLLLRRIESEVSSDSVSEKILEFLEIIEEMDRREGKSVSETMKAAYCAVAVDCTVRFLNEKVEMNRKYFETVKRIWRGRMGKMQKGESGGGLLSEELMRWKEEIEDAVWDSSVCERVLLRNTRNEALEAVRIYMTQVWKEMGPPFLQFAAQMIRDTGGFRMAEIGNAGGQQGGIVDVEQQGDLGSEERGSSNNAHLELVVYCKGGGAGGAQDTMVAKKAVSRARDDDDEGIGEGQRNTIVNGVAASNKETAKGKIKLREKHVGPRGRRYKTIAIRSRGVKINDADETEEDNICMREGDHHLPDTPDIHDVQESLTCSPTVRTAEQISARKRRYDCRNSAAANENSNTGEVQVPRSHVEEAAIAKGTLTHQKQNLSYNVEGSSNQNNLPGGNLKDQNLGSDVFDRYIFTGPSDGRRSPTPRSGNTSPLGDLATPVKLKRRQRKMWSPLEEDVLRQGVKKFGVGNWKLIYKAYSEIFTDRNEVDLKDKWRNLTRGAR
ncbi:hypothetical protein Dimus_011878 [Dionaea muscipula]